jgi:hypothetical protein
LQDSILEIFICANDARFFVEFKDRGGTISLEGPYIRIMFVLFYNTNVTMTITFCQEDISHDLYCIHRDKSIIGSCKIYLSGDTTHHIHIDKIKISCDVDIEELAYAFIHFAQALHCRVIEYPWIYVYVDGSYYSDFFAENDEVDDKVQFIEPVIEKDITCFRDINEYQAYLARLHEAPNKDWEQRNKSYRNANSSLSYQLSKFVENTFKHTTCVEHESAEYVLRTTIQVLVDDLRFNKKHKSVQFIMGFSKTYISKESKHSYSFHDSKDAFISKTTKKEKVRFSCTEEIEIVNVTFTDPLIVFIPHQTGIRNLYVSMTVDGVALDTWTNSEHFRLQNFRRYSCIETYNVFIGHKNVTSYNLYVINRLSVSTKFVDRELDYSGYIYYVLEPFAHCEVIEHNVKGKFLFVKKTHQHSNVAASATNDASGTMLNFGYIYLIREREFLQSGQQVYKVGQTIQKGATLQLRRLQDYKKGSELCFVRQVKELKAVNIETTIKREFNSTYTKHTDGHEYFYGDMESMIDVINKHCNACR